MITVHDSLPTSTLLEVKVGEVITDGKGQSGTVISIEISETDEFLMFLSNWKVATLLLRSLSRFASYYLLQTPIDWSSSRLKHRGMERSN